MNRLALWLILLVSPSLVFSLTPMQATAPEQSKGDSNDKIQDNLQSVLNGDPLLSGANVQSQVDDQSITLTGTVESFAQHQRALQLAEPFARWRKIVDKLKTTGVTQRI